MNSAPARWTSTLWLMGIALAFSMNHIGARLALDHGVSVLTAVTVRSTSTVLAVSILVVLAGVPLRLNTLSVKAGLLAGSALAIQGFCLYSAVARLPVALALLVFNTFPILIALFSWLAGGERPATRTMFAWPLILGGLVLALDAPTLIAQLSSQSDADPRAQALQAIEGIGFGLGAAASFAAAMVIADRKLGGVDGRVRSILTMSTVAILAGSLGLARAELALPTDSAGWLGLLLLSICYALAITGVFVVLPKVGAVNNSPILSVEPIFAMGLAAVLLNQPVSALQFTGALIVVGGIIFLSWSPPRPATSLHRDP